MNITNTVSYDDIPLTYAYSEVDKDAPWLTFVIPFALKLDMAEPFFDFFKSHYNIIALEARLFLCDDPQRDPQDGELTVENHAKDVISVLDAHNINKSVLIGYCSGAGIALSAVDQFPERFQNLLLVNGEFTLLGQPNCETNFAKDVDALLPMAADNKTMAEMILKKINASNKQADENIPEGINRPFSQNHYFFRYAVNYLNYRSVDYEALAAKVTNKTFIICGGKDLQTNIASGEKIKALISDATLYIDPNGDHYEILRYKSNTLVQIWNTLSESIDDDF